MLTFKEDSHIYAWDGQPVPSVTQVLNEFIKVSGRGIYVNTRSGTAIDAQTFENAQDFGTAMHMAAALILRGQGVEWNMLDEALVAPLRQFEKWIDDYKIKPLHIEQPFFSLKQSVAGTPDIIGDVRGMKHLSIIDIKTGLKNDMVGPQLAGYEILFREQEVYRKPIFRHELILPRDGSPYKFTLKNSLHDGTYFLTKLFQYNFKER